ncbi:hypothetical protein, partial [Rhodoblastus acidophilus]|uniref:hypothetical protein n=3 Tax=Rhodoblastus acidophilus TaxID=1074 RepID=UPI0019D4E77B
MTSRNLPFAEKSGVATLHRQQAECARACLKAINFQHFTVLTLDVRRIGSRAAVLSWDGAGWVFCSRAVGGARFCVGALRLVLSALIRAASLTWSRVSGL